MKRKLNSGFTLVELLVVISIIAMLLAVLVPALSKVREQARTVVCGTNLKNFGPAVAMYAEDNQGRFPTQYWLFSYDTVQAGIKTGKCPKECRWHYGVDQPDGLLWKYIKDRNVNMCPTYKNFAMSGGLNSCPNKAKHSTGRTGTTMNFEPVYSYAMNATIAGWRTPAMKLADVRRPGYCMSFSEENLWSIGQGARKKADPAYAYSNSILNDNLLDIEYNLVADNIGTYHKVSTAQRNEGFANCIFVDGHVTAVSGKAGPEAYLGYAKPYDGHEAIWKR
jgi:prepilin-type N-terminal cleavage/methylation domain-containing protein/prepilin-type processing-associated H-X9-DG protein